MTNPTSQPADRPDEPRKTPRLLLPVTFACMECGHQFKTTSAAEKATMNGCPGCGGMDIDLT